MKLLALCIIFTATFYVAQSQDTSKVKQLEDQIQNVQIQYNHTLTRLDELRQIGELEKRKVELESAFRRLSQLKAEAERDTTK